MRILIIAGLNDAHAQTVRWGLQELGVDPVMWYWHDFPNTDSCTFNIAAKNSTIKLNIQGVNLDGKFDVIWVRRKFSPVPQKDCHQDDKEIIIRESYEYLENILPYLGHTDTTWINELQADRLAENKLRQLLLAAETGFNIPATLAGNNYDCISKFYYDYNKKVVFKAFSPHEWLNSDGSKTVLRTSIIQEANIANEFAIHACPGIYQELIEKKYEARVTVIGDTVIAAKLDSQKYGATIDWRFDVKVDHNSLSPLELPLEVSNKCLILCKKMGLKFGAIDFIVDQNDRYIFLEINNAGQFLWIENYDPSITLLDIFCRFIANYKNHLNGQNKKQITLQRYFESKIFHDYQTRMIQINQDFAKSNNATKTLHSIA